MRLAITSLFAISIGNACASPGPTPARPRPTAAATGSAKPVAPEAPDAEAPKPDPHALREVARLAGTAKLFELDDGVVLAGGNFIAKLGDDGVTVSDELARGLELNRALTTGVVSLSGRRDGQSHALVERLKGEWFVGDAYRWQKGAWALLPLHAKRAWLGASEWSGGRLLLLGATQPATFVAVPGGGAKLPVLAPAPKTSPDADDEGRDLCARDKTALEPRAMLALPSGQVFAAGTRCDARTPALEWWEPGAKQGRLVDLPGVENRGPEVHLAGRRADDVWASVAYTLAHFDGKSWAPVELPFQTDVLSLGVTPAGELFVGSDSSGVWTRALDGKWSELSFESGSPSKDTNVWSIVARSIDDVWVLRGDSLYHSRPAKGGVTRVDPERFYRPPPDTLRPRELATVRCKSPFVLVYATTHFAPLEYDYPVLRSALDKLESRAGLRLELRSTTTENRYFLGVSAPNLERATQLVEHLKRELPAAQAKAYCYDAPVQALIDIDTGRNETPRD
jgi:hypothetical protein